MRLVFLLGILIAAACAGPPGRAGGTVGGPTVSLAYVKVEGRPSLAVTIINRTDADVCIRAELLRNPYSYAMDLRLRNGRGTEVKREKPGFLPPPIMDPVRIAPGKSVRGEYFLDARFKLRKGEKQILKGMSAQAAFRYDGCDASQSLRAVSAWQRI